MQILAAQTPEPPSTASVSLPAAGLSEQTVEVGPARGGQIFVQVGAFTLHENAHRLAAQLSLVGPVGVSSTFVNKQEFFTVRPGPSDQVAGADTALQQGNQSGPTKARIIVE